MYCAVIACLLNLPHMQFTPTHAPVRYVYRTWCCVQWLYTARSNPQARAAPASCTVAVGAPALCSSQMRRAVVLKRFCKRARGSGDSHGFSDGRWSQDSTSSRTSSSSSSSSRHAGCWLPARPSCLRSDGKTRALPARITHGIGPVRAICQVQCNSAPARLLEVLLPCSVLSCPVRAAE